MALSLHLTDLDLNPVGDLLDEDWTELECTRNLNAPAAGVITLVAWPEVMAELTHGRRLVITRDEQIWCAGPLEVPQDYEIDYTSSQAAPPGEVKINFSDDLAFIAGRRTYPNPLLPISDPAQPATYTATATNAELLIRTLVNLNAGPGALPARRVPQLVLGPVAGVGSNVNLSTRLEWLCDVLRTIALSGGNLVFGTQQVNDQIVFSVRASRDLTGPARFSVDTNNLLSIRYKRAAPAATTAIVGGSGEGADRVFVEVTNAQAEADWWRIEDLVDAGSAADDTGGELTRAGQEALAAAGEQVELGTLTVDTEDLQAGRDFERGDRVSVVLPTGLEVAELVRADTLQATPTGGELVTSLIGSSEATRDPRWVQLIREHGRRLGRMEAR